MKVTICDVAPRDGLQNEPNTLPPATRAELVNRLAAAGVPRIETVELRQPRPRAADGRRGGGGRGDRAGAGRRLRGAGAEREGLRPPAADRARRGALHLRLDGDVQQGELERVRGRVDRGRERIIARAHADGIRATVTIGASFGCPFEGAVDPGHVLERRGRARPPGPTRSSSPTRSASACRGRCAGLSRDGLSPASRSAPTSTTPATPATPTRRRRSSRARACFDASLAGIGGCPFAPKATGNIAPRISSTSSTGKGSRPESTSMP